MTAGIVESHIIIQGSIHAPCSKPIGNRPQAQGRERTADGKAEQGRRRHQNADRCDLSGAEPLGQAVTLKAGNDGFPEK